MGELAAAYAGVRQRLTDLVTGLTDEELTRSVPATPAWSVKELYAHLVGAAEDFVTGNLDQVAREPWTAAQVERRRAKTVAELVADWAQLSGHAERLLDQIPPGLGATFVADAVTHEHDLRGAVDRPGARDSDALWIALDRYIRFFGKRVKDARLPAVRIRAGEREWVAGVGEPAVDLHGEAFEIFRAIAGRRAEDEIRSLDWRGDPGPYLSLFSTFTVPAKSLGEPTGVVT